MGNKDSLGPVELMGAQVQLALQVHLGLEAHLVLQATKAHLDLLEVLEALGCLDHQEPVVYLVDQVTLEVQDLLVRQVI